MVNGCIKGELIFERISSNRYRLWLDSLKFTHEGSRKARKGQYMKAAKKLLTI